MSAVTSSEAGRAEVLSVDSARALTEQIRSAVVRTIDVLGEVDALVARAYDGRAWVVLEHESWEAYCAQEFAGARLWSSVDERRAASLRLRDAGLSLRAAAAVLGVSGKTVQRDEFVARADGVSTDPDAPVDTTVGLDGRCRPARRLPSDEARRRTATVVALRAQGRTQVEIAEELGVSQSTVSTHLAAATARGELDTAVLLAAPAPQEPHDLAPSVAEHPGRSRAAGLIAEARARAGALAADARVLREVVVDADEWATDVLFAAEVADLVAEPVGRAAGDLAYVLTHLDAEAVRVHAPADAHVHVLRSRRVRQIVQALSAGASAADVAADLGAQESAVEGVARQVAALPPDRRPTPDPRTDVAVRD